MNAKYWTYHNPTLIHFGPGYLDRLGSLIGSRRYALVTYPDEYFKTQIDLIQRSAGPATLIAADVLPNPDFSYFRNLSQDTLTALTQTELLIALGGGSVIDTAKVLAVISNDFADISTSLEQPGTASPVPLREIIAVPTTAGTGSEVTAWATVWDSAQGKKYSLNHPNLYPVAALVDPTLTQLLPPKPTLAAGLDALSHALESIWNINANPVSSAYAVQAATQIMATLPQLMSALDDIGLREQMSLAAVLAGLAFSNTKTALAHSISYPISLNHGVAHGIACSFPLPLVLRRAIGVDPDCDNTLRAIFGKDLAIGADNLERFLTDLGVSTQPDDYGLSEVEFSEYLKVAQQGERGKNFIAA